MVMNAIEVLEGHRDELVDKANERAQEIQQLGDLSPTPANGVSKERDLER